MSDKRCRRLANHKPISGVSDFQATPRGRSVLVIDDEPEVCALLRRILADEGYHVTAVRSARQALTVIRDQGFELVISDISLPDADGVELLRQICQEFPYLSVIAMSGFMAAIPAATLRDAGTTATLAKPFTPSQLLYSVAELLRPHRVSIAAG